MKKQKRTFDKSRTIGETKREVLAFLNMSDMALRYMSRAIALDFVDKRELKVVEHDAALDALDELHQAISTVARRLGLYKALRQHVYDSKR